MDESSSKNAAMPAWPTGISAITLFVQDLAAAKQFYQSAFGLPVMYEDDASTVFEFGPTLINLLKTTAADELITPAKKAGAGDGAQFVMTITVDDVDQRCAALTAQGVTLLNGPMNRPWGIRTASFMDPDGHIWEIAK